MLKTVLSEYKRTDVSYDVIAIGNGLIHSTWLVKFTCKDEFEESALIIQQVNTKVFTDPEGVCSNINEILLYLNQVDSEYFHLQLLADRNGNVVCKVYNLEMHCNEYFRVFNYIHDSIVYQTVCSPAIAFEAAKQFAKFTKKLAEFDSSKLMIPIPKFHDLGYRYESFESALRSSNAINQSRIDEAVSYIQYLQDLREDIVGTYEYIVSHPTEFKYRIMHHDSKISNVLFSSENKGLCVIDLDTCMPGYIISDLGDMFRIFM